MADKQAPAFHLFNDYSTIHSLRSTSGCSLAKDNDGKANRKALLASLRAGEHVELELDASVFFQADGVRNRNFTRFKKSTLSKFAKSFVGSPFLRDHQQWNMLAVGGRITKSQLEKDPTTGAASIEQTIRLSAPWAVEMALTGILDKFSIGWNPTGAVHCTACKADWSECQHWPGDELEDGVIVEAEFQSAEGIETSAVPIPAVPQVGISEVRAALAAAVTRKPIGDQMDITTLAKVLGVSSGDDIAELVGGIRTEHDDAKAKLALEREAHAQTKTALAEAVAAVKASAARELAAEANAIVDKAYADGRIKPQLNATGTRIETKMEKAIRGNCERFGIEATREYVAELPVVTPAGQASVAHRTAPVKAESGSASVTTFGPVISSALEQLGLTQDDALKHNPKIRNAVLA